VEHLRSLYPDLASVVQVIPLGVISEGQVEMSNDNVLRIVSCSYVTVVKRVEIIAEALRHMEIPVEWTHLGDGPLLNKIRDITSSLPQNIKVNFTGMIDSTQVLTYYKSQPIDIFVNVSSSEGVPFSIMEALSAGIPVFATDVGGTSDVIDDSVGKLLPPDITPLELAQSFETFYGLSQDCKKQIRSAAFSRYQSQCDAKELTRQLVPILLS
jgi:glycosyltransferase involved in cell wall biosynthesis